MADEKDENKVNEPSAEYHAPELRIFNSFEEMNEDQYKYWRSLTPEQRLADHYNLLTQVYKDEIEKNKQFPSNDIYFTA